MSENTLEVLDNNQNFYEILGVTKNASLDDIKKAYKTLALLKHPDKGGSTKEFSVLQNAFNTLKDTISKKKYDDSLQEGKANITISLKHSWKKLNSLEPLNVNYSRKIWCRPCRGKGYISHFVNETFIEPCIVCSGYGKLNSLVNKKMSMTCFNCLGLGKICIDNENLISHTHQCGECKGEKTLIEDNSICISTHDFITNEQDGNFILKGFGNDLVLPNFSHNTELTIGDLIIFVDEENNDKDIKRVGYDLYVNKYITFADCIFGGVLSTINPLTEKIIKKNIESLINSDGIFEHNKMKIILEGEGFTKQNGEKGNIIIQLLIIFPEFDLKDKEVLATNYGGITLES